MKTKNYWIIENEILKQTIQAVSKFDALKKYGCTYVYWSGNKPYSTNPVFMHKKIFAVIVPENKN